MGCPVFYKYSIFFIPQPGRLHAGRNIHLPPSQDGQEEGAQDHSGDHERGAEAKLSRRQPPKKSEVLYPLCISYECDIVNVDQLRWKYR